jgi:signal transduction histidine kinase/CheY-like chemotaxis protein/purine-cytosine permease-like protein
MSADTPPVPLGPAIAAAPALPEQAVQRVVKVRRDYNRWVARETMEDYALRFTPRSFRQGSEMRVANTAFGAASFLVLEAVGATLLVQHGFVNAFWAILATGLIIFLAGLPISVYAARFGLDMDLLTRGAGFGYLGSTLTSLVYASFTFLFFALEAAIMAYALELAFGLPPAWGYLVCALVVIPLVSHGVTAISRLQAWTQPLWLVMLVVPYVYVFAENPGLLRELANHGGASGEHTGFDLMEFGAALTVGMAMVTQVGEQADYLRFMPEPGPGRSRRRWWAGVLVGGPGWVVIGVLKMLGGALLACLALSHSVPADRAVDPNQMYLAAYEYVFPHLGWAVAATALFVIVSQLKINVTNAYAGSLAWSNFFARLTHSHPGRVVWVVFNTLIALVLMELDVFSAIGGVLGLYANVAIAWIMAVVADLVINKPLGLSPPGIEFKRAHLFDVNPVGVGAMGIASALSMAAHLGVFGPMAQAFSALIALVTALVAAPLIAWATKGRHYIARAPLPTAPSSALVQRCVVCDGDYEGDDMAHCPAYLGSICSLCCSLDARCGDLCKPEARLSAQWAAALRAVLPAWAGRRLDGGLGHYLLLMAVVVPVLAGLFGLLYHVEARGLAPALAPVLKGGFVKAFAVVVLASGLVAWWLVLTQQSRRVAQEESRRQAQAVHAQTQALRREIESHRLTDLQLQQAKRQAELANQAKSRYITTVSHELRTPLNSILGYAQLLEQDAAIPPHRRQAVSVIRRGGEHLLSLIEGTLDIARIEGGKLRLEPQPMRFREGLQQIVRLFELQAADKGLVFGHELSDRLPEVVRCDERRLRQILINVLGNAVKFTRRGRVSFRAGYAREMAVFEVEDTGPGIAPADMDAVFEPFARGAETAASSGTGLGLTISKMLTDLMGGEMTATSTPGVGTLFRIRLFLPAVHDGALPAAPRAARLRRLGYDGPRRRILVVDNEEADRALLAHLLQPLGFEVLQADSGQACLDGVDALRPDAILMDLAMPGLDGWATLRALRERGGAGLAPVAIVSGNAFDKELDNDAGVRPEDFVLKPVRLDELLDWLGARLRLDWVVEDAAAPSLGDAAGSGAAPQRPWRLPPQDDLDALQSLVDLGYLRGIHSRLDAIERADAAHAAFAQRMRALAQGFELDTLSTLLKESRHHA